VDKALSLKWLREQARYPTTMFDLESHLKLDAAQFRDEGYGEAAKVLDRATRRVASVRKAYIGGRG